MTLNKHTLSPNPMITDCPNMSKTHQKTIAHCYDIFYDINKAVHLVILFKKEEQEESISEDEDWCHTKKEALTCITLQMLTHYKKVYYTLINEIPSIKILIKDTACTSTLKKMFKKMYIYTYIVVMRTG
ncbi:hypothetical protein J3R82DRAFT_3619 [Butyriboletus roseoflavus]|nr:hypothetical protein J3R82DRAFT_3619 [Butyriboletus roseoflavus]